jgi:hypothetical protein
VLVCRAWETKMLARCPRKLKKIFADESLRQFRKVFRKLRWLESLG